MPLNYKRSSWQPYHLIVQLFARTACCEIVYFLPRVIQFTTISRRQKSVLFAKVKPLSVGQFRACAHMAEVVQYCLGVIVQNHNGKGEPHALHISFFTRSLFITGLSVLAF